MINVSFHAPSPSLRLKAGSAPGVNHLQQQHKSWQGAHLHSNIPNQGTNMETNDHLGGLGDVRRDQGIWTWTLAWQYNDVCKISYKVNEADDMLSLLGLMHHPAQYNSILCEHNQPQQHDIMSVEILLEVSICTGEPRMYLQKILKFPTDKLMSNLFLRINKLHN